MSKYFFILLVKSFPIELIVICSYSGLRSQCPDQVIVLETQAQVDSFQFHYPNCTEALMPLEVKGQAISNLQGLSVLTKSHLLTIDSTQVVSLDGLHNILEFGGIEISNNPLLTDISAIGQDANVIMKFEIVNNDALVNLTEFSFDSIYWFTIVDNQALTSLNGLENLIYAQYSIRISKNPSLIDLTGLANLSEIGGYISIYDNDRLKTLDGLGNLIKIKYDVYIVNNDSLQSLSGWHYIMIENHSVATIVIADNLQLDSCNTEAMCKYLADGYNVYFDNNAPGCNLQEEVQELCMPVNIAELISESDIIVYPNPTDNLLFFKYPNPDYPLQVVIYNHLGKEVLRKYQHIGPLNIAHLSPGFYTVKLGLKDSIKIANVVKL